MPDRAPDRRSAVDVLTPEQLDQFVEVISALMASAVKNLRDQGYDIQAIARGAGKVPRERQEAS
jgi:hypothetical protein